MKELADPAILRSDEIKAIYRRVMDAKTIQDTVGPGPAYDVPPPTDGYALVKGTAIELAASDTYRQHLMELDLLCYVTRARTSLFALHELDRAEIGAIGWRSVSCLIGNQAMVLAANSGAPAFLLTAT